ncbi:hypothetical protein [Ornithinibacillus californiensis]|nr:hypothetical protein [Ornithinibacillus californiensis]
MRKFLVVLFLMLIISFGVVGFNQQINGPEQVIKPNNPNTVNIQS